MHSVDDVIWAEWRLEEVAAMAHCAAFGCNYQTKGKKNSDVRF